MAFRSVGLMAFFSKRFLASANSCDEAARGSEINLVSNSFPSWCRAAEQTEVVESRLRIMEGKGRRAVYTEEKKPISGYLSSTFYHSTMLQSHLLMKK